MRLRTAADIGNAVGLRRSISGICAAGVHRSVTIVIIVFILLYLVILSREEVEGPGTRDLGTLRPGSQACRGRNVKLTDLPFSVSCRLYVVACTKETASLPIKRLAYSFECM